MFLKNVHKKEGGRETERDTMKDRDRDTKKTERQRNSDTKKDRETPH